MTTTNSDRMLVKIVKEICQEEHLEFQSFSYDWIFHIRNKQGKSTFIFWFQFWLNPASINSICCDKNATSEILTSLWIPNVEHFLFMSPQRQKYISPTGNWNKMIELLEKYRTIVCKPNNGTWWEKIFLVKNSFELEIASYEIFKNAWAMDISPYYQIENEWRTIVLNGEIKLIYRKERPHLTGDGIHSVGELFLQKFWSSNIKKIKEINTDISLDAVLRKNEIYYLTRKHNLWQGATPIIETNPLIKNKLSLLVKNITDKLKIRFASIDIISVNGSLKVIEINSWVMMEYFSQQNQEYYEIAKSIYRDAILAMLQ